MEKPFLKAKGHRSYDNSLQVCFLFYGQPKEAYEKFGNDIFEVEDILIPYDGKNEKPEKIYQKIENYCQAKNYLYSWISKNCDEKEIVNNFALQLGASSEFHERRKRLAIIINMRIGPFNENYRKFETYLSLLDT